MAKPDCKAPMSRAEYRESVRRNAIGAFTCEHCGIAAYRKQSGTNAGPNRFCSMECRTGASICAQAAKRESQRQKAGLRRLARAIAKVAKRKEVKPAPPCVVCAQPLDCTGGRFKRYCSAVCKKATPMFREAKRAAKHARRALTHGAHVERFTPRSIFVRDGWRCQICGVSTPESRRGTQHANAPELDHVQPLSKGGAHTRANTQCACRACNGWKSDRMVVGQVGLFTSLVPA